MRQEISVTRRGAVAGALLLVAFVVALTLLIQRAAEDQRERLPAGCSAADRNRPGCRPIRGGTDNNTVALAAVVVAPAAALAGAMIAARAAYSRHAQALRAEATRHAATLAHERGLADRQELRLIIDQAVARVTKTEHSLYLFKGSTSEWRNDLSALPEDQRGEADLELMKAYNKVARHSIDLNRHLNIIGARLGSKHDLYRTLATVFASVSLLTSRAGQDGLAKLAGDVQALDQVILLFQERLEAFLDTSRKYVGSQLND